MFYVYKWYIKETGEIFYIGKGCNNRYRQISGRNQLFLEYYHNNNCESEIIEYFEKEEEAFAKEHELLLYYHSIGQAKASLDNGGKGGCHFIWTPEMREYKSKYNPMKDEKQRKRMSESNPMKNPETAEKVNSQKRRAVVINNIRYDGVILAAEAVGVSPTTVCDWCKKGYTSDGKICRYEDELNKNFPPFQKATHITNQIGIYVDDIYFPNMKAAAKAFGFGYTGFARAMKSGQKTYKNHTCKQVNQQPSQENNQ